MNTRRKPGGGGSMKEKIREITFEKLEVYAELLSAEYASVRIFNPDRACIRAYFEDQEVEPDKLEREDFIDITGDNIIDAMHAAFDKEENSKQVFIHKHKVYLLTESYYKVGDKPYVIEKIMRVDGTSVDEIILKVNTRFDAFLALCEEYHSVFYVDLDKNEFSVFKNSGVFTNAIDSINKNYATFSEAVEECINKTVIDKEAEKIRTLTNADVLKKRLEEEDSFFIRYRVKGNKEGKKHFAIQVARLRGGKDEHRAVIGVRCLDEVVKDENARNDLERQKNELLKAALKDAEEANSAKTVFMSRISHDMRTPLNGIIGIIEMNERHPDDVNLILENRAKAKSAAWHLRDLINDVLELSKLDGKKIELENEAFDITEVMKEIIDIVDTKAKENGVRIRHNSFEDDVKYPRVCGSSLHVRQVYLNIIDNAIKYNVPGGRVDITLKTVSADKNKQEISCVIEDTGIGMNESFISNIFEPFVQEQQDARSSFQGTGLGMPIVKSILDKLGGTITIKSEKGVGSRFEVTLPLDIDTSSGQKKSKKQGVVADITGASILVVEDNDLNMEIAESILIDAGAKTVKAVNGKQALDIFEQCSAGTFDLILTDIMMPIMDGHELARRLRNHKRMDARNIPIIAMSANAFADDIALSKKAGMNAHIAKPLRADTTINILADALGREKVHIMTIKECYSRFGGNYEEVIERLGSEGLVERFMLKFKNDKSMASLKEAVEKGDIEGSFMAAHTLKGVSANLSFSALQKVASDLTEQLRPKTEVADAELYQRVCDRYNLVISIINDYEANK